MNKALMIAGIPLACTGVAALAAAMVAVVAVLTLWLVRATWAWVAPDLFPGAVSQGLIAESISWWTAFKLVVVLVVAGVIINGGSNRSGK